jgi:hypothetical protein
LDGYIERTSDPCVRHIKCPGQSKILHFYSRTGTNGHNSAVNENKIIYLAYKKDAGVFNYL